MKRYKVLYLTYENAFRTGILQAQVIEPLMLLTQSFPFDFTLTSVTKPGDEQSKVYKKNLENFIKKNSQIKLIELKKTIDEKQKLTSFIRDMFGFMINLIPHFYGSDIIHVRSYGPALVALIFSKLFRKKLIFDMRGVLPEETVLVGKIKTSSVKFKLLKWVERTVIKGCDFVFVVSEPFKNYVAEEYKVSNIYNISNPANYSNYEPKLKQWNCINIVYSGSIQSWHAAETTYKYLRDISEHFGSRVEITICANDRESHESMARSVGFNEDELSINSYSYSEMPALLSKSHIGFCITNCSFVTEVCCPVKFGEYLAANMAVITNEGIGDLADTVRKQNAGVVFESEVYSLGNSDILIRFIDDLLEKKSMDWSRDNYPEFNWANKVKEVSQIYDSILSKGKKK